MKKATPASRATISRVLIMLARAPPRPKCDSRAPRPRPSKAPPSKPFQRLGALAAGAGAGAGAGCAWRGAAAGAGVGAGAGAWRPTFCDWRPNERPPPMGRASASPSMDTVVAASIMPTKNFFNFISSPRFTGKGEVTS
ncbi:MAG: hypothetical protein EBS11_26410 [Janthinobacterium sp.]|nr:hypothetical protein [Janthinobacterium sp.]